MIEADQDLQRRERLTVRLLQTEPRLGDIDGNLDRLDSLVGSSADVVIAPELATHGYFLRELDDPMPLKASDSRLLRLGDHGPTVIAGFVEQHGHCIYNSAAVIEAGSVAVQRKLYPPNYRQWEERKHFRPGRRVEVFERRGAKFSVVICNDMWQPPVPWLAAHGGAEILFVPVNSVGSSVGTDTFDIWDLLLRHAAITLQVYVVFVNRTGVEGGAWFWGGSRVISPRGEVLAGLGTDLGELDVELDLADLRRLRRQWPLLSDPRLDVIAAEAARLHREEP